MTNDCISAISTCLGVGGIAVIRISGKGTKDLLRKIFNPQGKTKVDDFEPYKLYTGDIVTEGFSDYGMAVFFSAPKSYTGEDMAELHCHGGIAVTRGILRQTVKLGARPADKGEFTKRAFINGKLTLSSAEGLIDMINSESESEVKAGYYLYREKLSAKIREMQNELTEVLAEIDASIDFPEEGLEELRLPDMKNTLVDVKNKTDKLIKSYSDGKKIKQGVKIAIVGRPNTGKSSLLNALLDCDKAIVSPVAGTTRDVVEGSIEYDGITYNFYDTAGIRESDNEIEKIGVERSEKTLNVCDLALFVLDGSEKFNSEDEEIKSMLKGKNFITVINKTDKREMCNSDCDIKTSALNGENIDKLKLLIKEKTIGKGVDFGGDFLTEERHRDCLERAKNSLEIAINTVMETPLELVAVDIKNAWDFLGEISGETASENIIDTIFSKFCVGK